jgi:hypothetical protein
MIVSINQPAYLPWLGYFERIAASDLHIVLDHVQFEKNSFTNRNKIKTAQGASWLTVPVRTKGRFGELAIRSLEIDNATDWRAKHWKTLEQSYRRAPHFDEHAAFFEQVYRREWRLLHELLEETNGYLLRALGIATPLRSSSAMDPRGAKDELVLELCRKAGAKAYLSGALGRDYLHEEIFQQAGIRVTYQDYRHPQYPQLHGDFIPQLSVVDLLFNCGGRSLQVLKAQ